ncbi:hypothetical protein OF83DRAFT_1108238, partial [Amylostereum chailletii]
MAGEKHEARGRRSAVEVRGLCVAKRMMPMAERVTPIPQTDRKWSVRWPMAPYASISAAYLYSFWLVWSRVYVQMTTRLSWRLGFCCAQLHMEVVRLRLGG